MDFNKRQYIEIPRLTLNGDEDEFYKHDPKNNSKDFAELNFGKSVPLAAVIAILQDKAYKVATYEEMILAEMEIQEGCGIDKLVPTYLTLNQVVQAGSYYEASVFLSASTENIRPIVNFGGSDLSINEENFAKIKFTVSGGKYEENEIMKKTWTAKVGIPEGWNDYKYEELKGEYYVYKPSITVKADAVTALYEQCANTIRIKVPSLGSVYKPAFSSNAPIKKGKTLDELVIIPQSKEDVKMRVSNKGVFLDSASFKVMSVPLPRFMVYSGNIQLNRKVGITSKSKYLSLKVLPDNGFAMLLPKEANYSIGKMQIDVYAGCKLKNSFTTSNAQIKLPKLKDGDRIVIEIKKLYRTNSLGKKLDVELGNEGIMSVDVID